MSDAIVLEHVTKMFQSHLRSGVKQIVLHPWATLRARQRSRFVALDDVSLTVRHGENHGIIGRNGAGKSTLLGIVGGILRPTSGLVRVEGRIAPLLQLGVGFDQELTGTENAILNGVLLGMRRRVIESRLAEVLRFAGLEEFAEQPLKTYSSGMQSRLGFAVAVHSDPDVLLVDEVLAVGDLEFQERCLARIAELREKGATILFVSHALRTVSKVCDRVSWMEHGRLVATGPPAEVIGLYTDSAGTGFPGSRPS